MRLYIEKAEQLGLFGRSPKPAQKPAPKSVIRQAHEKANAAKIAKPAKPAGRGWQPIPGGKKGGFRKPKAGGGYEYLYPDAKAAPAASGKAEEAKKPSPKALDIPALTHRLTASKLIQETLKLAGQQNTPKSRKALETAKRIAGSLGVDYRWMGTPEYQRKIEAAIQKLSDAGETAVARPATPPQPGFKIPEPPADIAPKPDPALAASPKQKPVRSQAKSGKKYEDVGEKIGGARKDMAALARMSQEDLEKDPGAAFKIVTRDNVLGKWTTEHMDADRASGLSAEVSLLKRSVMLSVAVRPPDSSEDRDRYRRGCKMLQESLSRVRTVSDVKDMLDEWADSGRGVIGDRILDRSSALAKRILGGFKAGSGGVGPNVSEHYNLLDEGIAGYRELPDGKLQILKRAASLGAVNEGQAMILALGRNFAEMGNMRVLAVRGRKRLVDASSAFMRIRKIEHYTPRRAKAFAEAVGIRSYEDLEKHIEPKEKTSKDVKRVEGPDQTFVFQRDIGAVERKGLAKIASGADGQAIIKDFNFRGVEYGNWASNNERQWHTEMAHASLKDLAMVLGIEDSDLAINGRLALAFGARGSGGKNAGVAHYEPSKRVINLTKFQGNGSLAHEYGHFLDHAVSMAYNPGRGKTEFVSTGKGEKNVPPEIVSAFREVMSTIKTIPAETRRERREKRAQILPELNSITQQMNETPLEVRQAYFRGWGRPEADKPKTVMIDNPPPGGWKDSDKVPQKERDPLPAGVTEDQARTFGDLSRRREELRIQYNLATSMDTEFYKAAQSHGSYWASDVELFARSFESFIESKLTENGQRSSYLVDGTLGGSSGVYLPHGHEHRTRINSAIGKLLKVLRGLDQFKKASYLVSGTLESDPGALEKGLASQWLDSLVSGPSLVLVR